MILLRICVFFFFFVFFCLFNSFVLEFRFLKIGLSYTHKWVTSSVILFKINFSLVISSPGGPGMVNG